MVVNITQLLQELGFSEYEARTFAALKQHNPSTAYEAAKTAGIPTSKIYQVIEKLLVREVVLPMEESGKVKYVPLENRDLLQHYRSKMSGTLNDLERALENIESAPEVSYLRNISGHPDFIARAKAMITKAEKSVLISVWEEEYRLLANDLYAAAERKCSVAAVFFGNPVHQNKKDLPFKLFTHPIRDTLYAEKGGRGFTMVTDRTEALMATLPEISAPSNSDINRGSPNEANAAWSSTPGFVNLAEDYIKHDIYIMKIVDRFERELKNTFGPGYEKLRDIYSDEEEK